MLSRRSFIASSVGALASPSLLLAQRTGANEREIVPQMTANDKEGIWTLHFRFMDPRVIVEKVPARGTKICWGMIYRVYNLDSARGADRLRPRFELVTLDRHTRHRTTSAGGAGSDPKFEDPTGWFENQELGHDLVGGDPGVEEGRLPAGGDRRGNLDRHRRSSPRQQDADTVDQQIQHLHRRPVKRLHD